MGAWRRRVSVAAGLALVALVARLAGRELTHVVDPASFGLAFESRPPPLPA